MMQFDEIAKSGFSAKIDKINAFAKCLMI